jgi:hypothetical protein
MSNATPFALGLGGGLALWHFLGPSTARATSTRPSSASTPAPNGAPSTNTRNARTACLLQIDASGLAVDGTRVELAEAVRRAQLADRAQLAVSADAPASTCAELMAALRAAGVASRACAPGLRARNAAPEVKDFYSLITYPRGIKDKPTIRYFRAEQPIEWSEARDRLAAAGLLDLSLAGRTREPGGWMLSIDPKDFRIHRAEPLPGTARPRSAKRPRGAARAEARYTTEGRRIFRDGTPILYVDRVDLGDQQYAISPHHADRLTERMVRLLNKQGARP